MSTDRKQPGAIITGAGSGVGQATAMRLAQLGFNLALVGRRAEMLKATEKMAQAQARSVEIHCIPIDLRSKGAAEEIVKSAQEHLGAVNTLINNAGIAELAPIEESGGDILTNAFEINALGPGRLISALWPMMVARSSGCIVNISSMAAQDPFPGFFAYAASKAAVNLFTASCAKEGADHNIRAFSIAPGAIETAMLRGLFDESAFPASLCLTPEGVAQVIVDCVMGKRDADNGTVIWLPNPQ